MKVIRGVSDCTADSLIVPCELKGAKENRKISRGNEARSKN